MKKSITSILVAHVVFTLISCVSCSDEVAWPDTPTVKTERGDDNPYKVPLSEALRDAENLMHSLDGVRTRNARVVSQVEYVLSQDIQTRSPEGIDTLLYVVSYGEDEGFAILGADKRMPSVYAIANEGNICLADTSDNPGLAMFMDNVRTSIGVFPGYFPGDSIGWKPIEPVDPGFGDRQVTYLKQIRPMLSKYASRWGQYAPFNRSCWFGSGSAYCAVGCVPLACAQIMSFYKWPLSYKSNILSWQDWNDWYDASPTAIESYCPYGLQVFLRDIGVTLEADYGSINTGVLLDQLKSHFHDFGYEPIGNQSPLKHSTASVALEKTPILVLGEATSESDVNHTWVIDGYLSYKEVWDAIANPNHTIFRHMYHCLWGYMGKNNGYFLCSDGGVMGTSPFSYDENDLEESDSRLQGKSFQELVYFSNFKPVR